MKRVGDMTLVIIQSVASKIHPYVWHHIVASPDAPTAPQARDTHQRDEGRYHPDRLINWGRKLVEGQEVRHPVVET